MENSPHDIDEQAWAKVAAKNLEQSFKVLEDWGGHAEHDPTADEVKWQVALFALMPLALAAMTQPVGYVLNRRPEYRFWLRSSPIYCAGDMVVFVIRVCVCYILAPTFSWKHVKAEIAYRFRDDELAQPGSGYERTILGRWLLLGLSGIPCQTIKLVGMEGVPWTLSFALLYFLSIVFGEAMHLSAILLFGSTGSKEDDYAGLPANWHRELTGLAETVCSVLHLFVYYIISIQMPIGYTSVLMVVLNDIVAAANLGFGEDLSWSESIRWPIVVLASCYITSHRLAEFVTKTVPGRTVPLFLLSMFGSLALLGVAFGMAQISSRLLRILAGTSIGKTLGVPATSLERILVVWFVVSFILSVLSYAYAFDGTGTVNPSWLGVFG
jgi:hypothetical protein